MKSIENPSRRDFLKTAAVAGAGSLVAGTSGPALAASAEGEKSSGPRKVSMRPFGKTGVEVSSLSLGGMFDIPSNQLILRQAHRFGVTHWDTAASYGGGNSEKGMGQFFEKSPELRKDIFLVTKSDSKTPDGMTRKLERSLDLLKTDYIDLYFLHSVRGIDELDDDIKRWAERAKAQGKIRWFGFSTHSNVEECLTDAAKLGWIDGIMMSYNFRTMHRDAMKAAVDRCVEAGIGLTAMKTQGGGPVPVESETQLEMAATFMKKGFSEEQAKLKAVWEDPRIANICSQMPTLSILMANIAAALNQAKLSAEDRVLLDRYAKETEGSYCAGCARVCQGALAEDLPVQDVLRCLMYRRSYGDADMARSLFAEIPREARRRLVLADFSPAERSCPRKLPIGRLMKEAVDELETGTLA